ncbi:O-antigen translocase [uncultured Psychroserpens sp.]|uniref:O-antigen translocase n=1 Tax=uncultured Psychroserpens sp. TaxID=255436 RepID=UPI002638FD3D|nr:O-antigen translocase [uncultured Psychroserpens sp.]
MKQRLKHLINNNLLLKIASINSVSVALRIFSGLITSKLLAIFIGPNGLAYIGNLHDVINSGKAFSTLGLGNGIVKYVAEFRDNIIELGKIVSTVFYCILGALIIISLFVYFNAQTLNDIIFTSDNDYAYIIRFLGVVLPLYAFKTVMFSILNGLSRFKQILHITIVAQIIGLLLNVLLIWKFQLKGALLSILIVEIVLFLITLVSASDLWKYFRLISLKKIAVVHIKNLGAFTIMALFSATVLPLVSVFIRNYIIDDYGESQAGFWVAMQRISNYYLMFVTSLITLYILPRFSQINTSMGFRKEVFSFYKTIVPLFFVGLVIIYFLRSFIINLVFDKDFQPVTDLFLWQLLGDFIKVLSLVISYQFIAKKMVWHYIIVETLAIATILVTSIICIDYYGLIGVVKAHFVSYLIHFAILLFIFRKSLFGKFNTLKENHD